MLMDYPHEVNRRCVEEPRQEVKGDGDQRIDVLDRGRLRMDVGDYSGLVIGVLVLRIGRWRCMARKGSSSLLFEACHDITFAAEAVAVTAILASSSAVLLASKIARASSAARPAATSFNFVGLFNGSTQPSGVSPVWLSDGSV